MNQKTKMQNWRDITLNARDGITLYGRHYPATRSWHHSIRRRPVLCLAGLTRNSRDFHVLATALSNAETNARDVYTFDCRGRGLSEYAPSWKDYIPPIEMLDVQDFMASQNLHHVGLIGTSRGGLIAMLIASDQPSLIGTVILNDIGPIIDPLSLIRMGNSIGKTSIPRTWNAATEYLKQTNSHLLPEVSDAEWADIARQWFNEKDSRPAPGYDPTIARTFSFDTSDIPELWPQFMALKRIPCLVIRGALSDFLSEATAAQMCSRHPRCTTITVRDQGHAPLLRDAPTIMEIANFLTETDPPN